MEDLTKVSGYPAALTAPMPAFIASSIISSLPFLQNVKLALRTSDSKFDLSAVAQALSRLERLQSLDVVDCGVNVCGLGAFMTQPSGPALLSLRIPTWQGDRYGAEVSDTRRSLVTKSPYLRALEICGTISVGLLARILASLTHPERLLELRITIMSNTSLPLLTRALSLLTNLEILRVQIAGGIETAFGTIRTYTYTMDELKVGYASRLSNCVILKGFAGNGEIMSDSPSSSFIGHHIRIP